MRFLRVAGESFRLFDRFEFEPAPGVNLILGANAAGKTSVLEAIYALGRGRGFRAAASELAGSRGQWTVHGRLVEEGRPESSVGVAWSSDGLLIRIDGSESALQDLVARVPVQILEPDSHRLIE